MNILLIVLAVLGAIIALLLLVALFIKNEYTVVREITIAKPRQDVFNYIKLLRNQDHYSKWVMMDPHMKKNFTGVDGMVGFVYAWDSENKQAGKGAQEIMKLIEGERVDAEVRFIKPFEAIAITYMITGSVPENKTKVTWGMNGRSKYPMTLMNPFMDNLLGKDLQTSLSTLKNILEK